VTVDLNTLANLAQAVAVVVAVGFGILQVRQIREQRRRESTFALMQSLLTRDVLHALLLLDSLPEGLHKATLEERLGEDVVALQTLLGMWESLGVLVFHREIPLDLVDEFYSGPIVHSWSKLRRFVEDVRRQTDRETRWEWFQWLAERMLEREALRPPVPAYVAHRAWKSA